jgi:hypothetical protein
MNENLARKPLVEKVRESDAANEPIFGTELKLVPKEPALTEIEAVEMLTLQQNLLDLPNVDDLPEGFPVLATADLVEVVADDAFAVTKARLTRADFTKEGIEAARAVNLNPTTKNESPSQYPEDQKIEPGLRVEDERQYETSVTHLDSYPPITPDNRLTRAYFPGQGSAAMPELVFKKPAPVAKKGFFKRLIPSLLKKFF